MNLLLNMYKLTELTVKCTVGFREFYILYHGVHVIPLYEES